MLKEVFYRRADGKLLFKAIKSAGVSHAVSCNHGWTKNGFPKEAPKDRAPETIDVAPKSTQKYNMQ
jgi:hypothetical protein